MTTPAGAAHAGPGVPGVSGGPGAPPVDPGLLGGVELVFLSFTEVTEDTAHRPYNEWHQLDHLPEQLPLPGVLGGRRWARTAACLRAGSSGPLLARTHYLTLYLMAGPVEQTLRDFWSLAGELRRAGRFFEQRRALLSGPFTVEDVGIAERVAVSMAALPHRPDRGVYVRVERGAGFSAGTGGAPLASLVSVPGVAGAWRLSAERRWPTFGDAGDLTVTVCWLDEEPLAVAPGLRAVTGGMLDETTDPPVEPTGGPAEATGGDGTPVFEGPLVSVIPWRWDELEF